MIAYSNGLFLSFLEFHLNSISCESYSTNIRNKTREKIDTFLFVQGNNGLRIAYGEEQYTSDKAKISVPLREHGWYHIRNEIRDIPTRSRRTEFRGDPVTKIQMMRVLADLKYLMIRAQYHSEQIEGRYVWIVVRFLTI